MQIKTIIRGHEIAGRMPLFKPELRQANRDKLKRMTRRVIIKSDMRPTHDAGLTTIHYTGEMFGQVGVNLKRPYQVGEIRVMCEPLKKNGAGYAVYGDDTLEAVQIPLEPASYGYRLLRWRWKRDFLTSIHMPYEAARSLFRITEVRAERLRDISIEDIIAEGLSTTLREHDAAVHLREQMTELWNSINAKRGYPWKNNNMIWVIVYEEVE